jgi:hypothetical protein
MDNNDMTMEPGSNHFMNEDFVMTVQDCEAVCEHMTHHLMRMQMEDRVAQAMLLRECADICGVTAKFAARDAIYARNMAALCADICQACGTECLRYPDDMSQHCAMVCLNCAKHCRSFAAMGMPHMRRQREMES